MAYQGNPHLNLASILETIRTGAQASTPPTSAAFKAQPLIAQVNGSYGPPAAAMPGIPFPQHAPPYQGPLGAPADASMRIPTQPQPVALQPPLAGAAPARPASVPPIDPRTIVAWPPALRHVTRLLGQNEALVAQVRRLVEAQHRHEREWHRGREQLVQTQRTRKEAGDKVADVLRSLGGRVAPSTDTPTPEEDQEELQRYDAKFYRACKEMQCSMTAELEGLRIPFFCIRPELVGSSLDAEGVTSEEGPEQRERLSSAKLHALKRRMLELLEDMCKE